MPPLYLYIIHFTWKVLPMHTLLRNKPASMEWSIRSSPTWMIAWPELTPALQQGTRHNSNTFYWEDLATSPSMEVSSSWSLQLPSCGEGIQTRKNWLNTNWQVIDATATSGNFLAAPPVGEIFLSRELRWTISSPSQLPHRKTAIPPFPVTSEKQAFNQITVWFHHCLLCLLNWCTALHMKAKPWTHSTCCKNGRSALHLYFSSEKCSKTNWTKFCLRLAPSLKSSYVLHVLTHNSHGFSKQDSWICTCSKLLAFSSQFSSVLILDLKRIANELKATTVVLQGQQPRHSNSTLSNRVLLAFTYQRVQQRNKRMAPANSAFSSSEVTRAKESQEHIVQLVGQKSARQWQTDDGSPPDRGNVEGRKRHCLPRIGVWKDI